MTGRRPADHCGEDGISALVRFWTEAGERGLWFEKDAAFDRAFRERFLDRHRAVAARRHDDWTGSAEGSLALILLTDQFPRNAFRGTARMYATDALARHYARAALDAGHWERIAGDLRLFLCLPFAHAEDLPSQDLSVALNARLGRPWLDHAEGHRAIIARFGRFPHRNAMLGRATTAEEAEFLAGGGFDG